MDHSHHSLALPSRKAMRGAFFHLCVAAAVAQSLPCPLPLLPSFSRCSVTGSREAVRGTRDEGAPPWNSILVALVKSSDQVRASNTCTRAPTLSPNCCVEC